MCPVLNLVRSIFMTFEGTDVEHENLFLRYEYVGIDTVFVDVPFEGK